MSKYTVEEFRLFFLEFSDETKYTDIEVQKWIYFAERLLPLSVWKTLHKDGVFNLVAHNLTLFVTNMSSISANGIVSGKSVGGVSVSYDTSNSTFDKGGLYNTTKYGMLFLHLKKSLSIIQYVI